ncbi:hypothetical protein B0H12DRAFT_518627 [Mycena haematopus]|nr:hypothetical protein B0H12DRAFT_518627 [Mycena haematopus]
MRAYGNRLQFLPISAACSLTSTMVDFLEPRILQFAAPVSSTTMIGSHVLPRPLSKRRPRRPQHNLMKFIKRTPVHGTYKSKLVIQALQRRLLRRGLNSPHTPAFALRQDDFCAPQPEQPESPVLPIVLPQLLTLSLPCLYPETDSGYCSDGSRSPSCSPKTDVPERRATGRRYIRPDLLAASPSDFGSTSDFRVRLSAHRVKSIPHSFASCPLSSQDRLH